MQTDTNTTEPNPEAGEIALGNGYTLSWRIDPSIGAREYWSDEIGGGVIVWNTALVSEAAMLAALMMEQVFMHNAARRADVHAAAAEAMADAQALRDAAEHEASSPKDE